MLDDEYVYKALDDEYVYNTSSSSGYEWEFNTDYWYSPNVHQAPQKIKIENLVVNNKSVKASNPVVMVKDGVFPESKTLHIAVELDEYTLQKYNGCTVDLADAIVAEIREKVKEVLLDYNRQQREKKEGA